VWLLLQLCKVPLLHFCDISQIVNILNNIIISIVYGDNFFEAVAKFIGSWRETVNLSCRNHGWQRTSAIHIWSDSEHQIPRIFRTFTHRLQHYICRTFRKCIFLLCNLAACHRYWQSITYLDSCIQLVAYRLLLSHVLSVG